MKSASVLPEEDVNWPIRKTFLFPIQMFQENLHHNAYELLCPAIVIKIYKLIDHTVPSNISSLSLSMCIFLAKFLKRSKML